MSGRSRILFALGFVVVLIWGCYRSYRAHHNLVTLNVRNMDARKVLSKIEWQTWEQIIVHKDLQGPVTLDVKDAPIEDVLNIMSIQLHARWTALYPIYARRSVLGPFKKAVRGDIAISGSGWTNLFTAPSWRRGNIGGFASNSRMGNKLVSAQFSGEDLGFAALALSRFSQAQVVPENTARGTITLSLKETPFEDAVARVAAQANRKWDGFYTLQPLGGFYAPPRQRVAASTRVQPNPGASTQIVSSAAALDRAAARQREFEATLVTMSPAEREKAREQWNAMEELRSMAPEQRQQRLQEMAAQSAPAAQQDLQQRMQNRLRNSTPDQRVERDRIRLERQKQQQRQATP